MGLCVAPSIAAHLHSWISQALDTVKGTDQEMEPAGKAKLGKPYTEETRVCPHPMSRFLVHWDIGTIGTCTTSRAVAIEDDS
jgi:hypothetical protein